MHKQKLAIKISQFSNKEIKLTFKNSRYIYKSPEFDLKSAPKIGSIGRILIVTSKKVGNAPERNLIRRRVKSIFYEEKIYLGSYDFIMLCKKDILNLSFSDLKSRFKSIISKLY